MKGNQGLEALATLCNNASQTEEQEASMQSSNDVRNNHHHQQNNHMNTTPMPAPAPNGLTPYAGTAQAPGVMPQSQGGFNALSANVPALLKGFGASAQQQAPNLLAAAAGGLGNNDASNAILQQYVQLMQQQQQAQQQPFAQLMSQASQPQYPFPGIDPNALLLAAQRQAGSFQVLPTPTNPRIGDNSSNGSMKPPQFAPSRASGGLAQSSTVQAAAAHAPILSRRNADNLHPDLASSLGHTPSSVDDAMRARADSMPISSASSSMDKKMQKRAANRRSAQLSRKRKKQFIEELKEENDDLRRKEQILRSIPDLIVVFDSSGKLGFVSHSVSNFLQFTPGDLVGTSFWERLCENSVRLLKAAFMDALAARSSEHETTPLGSGVWELRLQDKNGNFVLVTLNGVVHFSGEAPECVCSIRPVQERTKKSEGQAKAEGAAEDNNVKKESDTQDNMKAGQSVVAGKRPNPDAAAAQRNVRPKHGAVGGNPVSISDVDSGTSVVSTND